MIADYHIHTRLCGHAEGEPREYVERAIALGMTEMGFSDRLPFLEDLQREYARDVTILLGVEADYIEETLDEAVTLLDVYPFDCVIGTVHFVGDRFSFDHAELRDELSGYGIDRVYLESYALVERAGAAIELNAIGWRQPVGEAYPAPALPAVAADLDIPLTFGSGAHRPAEVGYEFTGAGALAREAGYSAVLRLSDGRPQALA